MEWIRILVTLLLFIGLTLFYHTLFLSFWTHKEGARNTHNSDAWVFGALLAALMAYFLVHGVWAVFNLPI